MQPNTTLSSGTKVVLSNLLYKIPQIETLKTLNALLAEESSSAKTLSNEAVGYLNGFLKENGLQILLQVLNNRIESGRDPNDSHKLTFKVYDIAILYECIQCCKSIAHDSVGINRFMALPKLISAIARCLNFQCKILSLSIIDLFDHCISQSVQFATVVYGGIQVAAATFGETPFKNFSVALVEQDIEQKAAILKLINSLQSALKSDDALSAQLNCDLSVQLFDEKYEEALNLVDSAIDDYNNMGARKQKLSFKSTPSSVDSVTFVHFEDVYKNQDITPCNMHPAVFNEEALTYGEYEGAEEGKFSVDNPGFFSPFQKNPLSKTANNAKSVETVNKSVDKSAMIAADAEQNWQFSPIYPANSGASANYTISLEDISINSARSEYEVVNVHYKSKILSVCPQDGTMAGSLITTKSSKFITMFTRKTKTRWFEIDNESFHSMEGFVDIPNANDGQSNQVLISSITHVKSVSTNSAIANETTYSFEIETSSQTYVFGCTDSISRERWLTAIYASLTKHILSKSSYESRRKKEISVRSVIKFADAFKEQGIIYSSVANAAQRFSIDEHGINVNDIHEVSLYLQNEMLAAGLSSKLLQIFQEFLLIPFQTESAWNAIYNGVKIIRKHCHNKKAIQGGEATTKLVRDGFAVGDENTKSDNSKSVVQMLKLKMEEAGSSYPEVSRLAMVTIAHEKEKTELLDRIRQLEEEYLTNNGEKKKFLSIAEANEHMRVMRMTQKIKDLEEFFASDQIRLQKQENKIQELENKLEASRNDSEELRQVQQKLAECEKKLETAQKEAQMPQSVQLAPNPFLAQLKKRQPVIAGTPSKTTTKATTAAVETAAVDTEAEEAFNKKFFKYKMMKKVLPEAAVRQKMTMDGFSPEEIEEFLSGAITSSAPTSQPIAAVLLPPPPPAAENAAPDKFDKYRTMKKMFPLAVLRHKMTADGLTAEEIEGFIENSDKPPASLPPISLLYSRELASSSLSSISSDESSLNSGQTSNASLNSGSSLPNPNQLSASIHNQLKQSIGKTTRDHPKPKTDTSTAAPAAVLKAPTPIVDSDAPPEGMAEKVLAIKPSVKLKGLFWSKLKSAELKNTVFVQLDDFQIPETVCKEIDDLFAAKVLTSVSSKLNMDSSKAASSNKDSNPNAPEDAKPAQVVSVLDGKRIQNVLIVMGKLRLGAEEIMNMIIDLDPRVLTAEVTASIISILPLAEEVNALKSYSASTNFDQASKLYFNICRIPRLVTRLDCHEIAFSWQVFSKQVSGQMETMLQGCTELEKCKTQMQSVLSIVLAVGNYLNADTKFGKAYGFKIEAINKLESLKASKSAYGSMINVLANLVADNVPDIFAVSQAWVGIPAAANISLQQTSCDVNKLEQQVNRVNQEFLRIKDGQENVGLDGVLESCTGPVTYPLHRRLNEFLIFAKPKIGTMKAELKNIEKSVTQIMTNYGEKFSVDGDEDQFKKFFASITNFYRSLRTAMDDNIKRRKAQEKAAYQEQEQKARLARREASIAGGISTTNTTNNIMNNPASYWSRSPSPNKGSCSNNSNKVQNFNEALRMRPRRLSLDIPKENLPNPTQNEIEEKLASLKKNKTNAAVEISNPLSDRNKQKRIRSDGSWQGGDAQKSSPNSGSNNRLVPRRINMSPPMQWTAVDLTNDS